MNKKWSSRFQLCALKSCWKLGQSFRGITNQFAGQRLKCSGVVSEKGIPCRSDTAVRSSPRHHPSSDGLSNSPEGVPARGCLGVWEEVCKGDVSVCLYTKDQHTDPSLVCRLVISSVSEGLHWQWRRSSRSKGGALHHWSSMAMQIEVNGNGNARALCCTQGQW